MKRLMGIGFLLGIAACADDSSSRVPIPFPVIPDARVDDNDELSDATPIQDASIGIDAMGNA